MVADAADMTSMCNCERFQRGGWGGGLMLLTRHAQATAVNVFKRQSARGPRSRTGHGNTPHHTTTLSTTYTYHHTHTTHLQTEGKSAQDFAEDGGELEADRHTSLAADSCVSSPGGAVYDGAQ